MLDLGIKSAWVTIKAKCRLGDFKVYIGINVYKKLIKIDAISNIKAYKFKRSNASPGKAVYLIIGNFVDKAVLNKARKLLLEKKGGFNAIFLAIGPQYINT